MVDAGGLVGACATASGRGWSGGSGGACRGSRGRGMRRSASRRASARAGTRCRRTCGRRCSCWRRITTRTGPRATGVAVDAVRGAGADRGLSRDADRRGLRDAAVRLLRRLVLEERQRMPDGSGGFAVAWVPLGTLWADVTARAGREDFIAGRPRPRVRYRILVRGRRRDAVAAAAEQRLREGARVFDDPDGGRARRGGATSRSWPRKGCCRELCFFGRAAGRRVQRLAAIGAGGAGRRRDLRRAARRWRRRAPTTCRSARRRCGRTGPRRASARSTTSR